MEYSEAKRERSRKQEKTKMGKTDETKTTESKSPKRKTSLSSKTRRFNQMVGQGLMKKRPNLQTGNSSETTKRKLSMKNQKKVDFQRKICARHGEGGCKGPQ
ncbi:hypothetical protein RUM44_002250 [Polyplax serrata]|uniref:Uncharacterized protein n=1 Tax=Polyplax serrata TaxID=468196 RepID=A0ABR1AMD6_POLSC